MSAIPSTAALARLDRGTVMFCAILGLAALVVALFHESYAGIWQLWQLSTYQYAFLVAPIAVYLIWSKRHGLAAAAIQPSWAAVAALFLLTMMWQVSRATAVQAAEHTVAMLAVPTIVFAVLGPRVFGVVRFPVLLLLTLIPIGEVLTPPLMVVTAEIASALLHLFGVPFTRNGQFMSLSGGNFEVADVCSGVRYLLASGTLSLLFAYLNFRSLRTRALFVAATAVVFIIGNGVRAFIVMTVASATNMAYFGGRDHVVFGMIFFAVLLLLVFWIGARHADAPRAAPAVAAGSAAPKDRRVVAALITAILALAAGPAVQANRSRAADARDLNLRLPLLAACGAPVAWRGGWTPLLHGADAQQRGSYDCGDIDVHVLLVAYVNQTNGRELISSENVIVPPEWQQLGVRSQAAVPLHDGSTLGVNEMQITTGGQSTMLWYWYGVNGAMTVSNYGVKLREALATMTLRPVESRAYVVSVVGPANAKDVLRTRAQQTVDALLATSSEP